MNRLGLLDFPLYASLLFCTAITAGYIGEKAYTWISQKCQTTEKIDTCAQATLQPSSVTDSPSIADLTPHETDLITMGQGEYIVFYGSGRETHLTHETFQKVYTILNQYIPSELVQRNEETLYTNRYDLIQQSTKSIHSDLDVAFVPRTLYELIFLKECIYEDIQNNKVCDQIYLAESGQFPHGKIAPSQCWHSYHFQQPGALSSNEVHDLAYRLNKILINRLSPMRGGFTYQELAAFTEREVHWFQKYYRINPTTSPHFHSQGPFASGPTWFFAIQSEGAIQGSNTEIIFNAVALECSRVAAKALLLYRGSHFERDEPYLKWSLEQSVPLKLADTDPIEILQPHSLSFGVSLFAGGLYDFGAIAFSYMQPETAQAYAITLPITELRQAPFYVPPGNSLVQLFGEGELFHGRSKVWKGITPPYHFVSGIDFHSHSMHTITNLQSVLVSSLSREELIDTFHHYKQHAIQLKSQERL